MDVTAVSDISPPPPQYFGHPASYYGLQPAYQPQIAGDKYNAYAGTHAQAMYQVPFYSMYPAYTPPHLAVDVYSARQPAPLYQPPQLYRPYQHFTKQRKALDNRYSQSPKQAQHKAEAKIGVLQPMNMNKGNVSPVEHSKPAQSVADSAGPQSDFPIPMAIAPSAGTAMFSVDDALKNPRNTTNVYIRGLAPNVTDESLVKIAARFGKLTTAKAMMDNATGMCKGFGFAQFETEQEAAQCICGLAQYGYQTSFAKQSFSLRLKELQDSESTNVYFSNIPRYWDKAEFKQLLAEFPVVSLKVLRDGSGSNRGVGFARFADRAVAEEVIGTFNGQPIGEGGLPIQVRFSDTEAQKKLKQVTVKKRNWRAHEYHMLAAQLALENLSLGNKPAVYNPGMLLPSPEASAYVPPNAGATAEEKIWLSGENAERPASPESDSAKAGE